jgi:DNA-binding CsgD family transcriptional regulator
MPRTTWPTVDQILGLAYDAPDREIFRAEMLRVFADQCGADAGVFIDFDVPVPEAHVLHLPHDQVDEVRRLFLPDAIWEPMVRAMGQDGAAVDLEVIGQRGRERLSIYRDYLVPYRIRTSLCADIVPPRRPSGLVPYFCIMRTSSRPFPHGLARRFGRLVRAIAVADASLGRPPVTPDLVAERWPPTMTERQREIVTHVIAGMTNHEIARQCGISVHTVRNHLVTLFRQFDVLTRTELAMKIAGQR